MRGFTKQDQLPIWMNPVLDLPLDELSLHGMWRSTSEFQQSNQISSDHLLSTRDIEEHTLEEIHLLRSSRLGLSHPIHPLYLARRD